MDELSENDKLIVARACKIHRFLSQSFHVAEMVDQPVDKVSCMSLMMKQLCWHLKLYLKHQNLHEKGFLYARSVALRHKPENGTLHRRLTF